MTEGETSQLAGVQAHFGRAVKERNWSLFLFFRILAHDEARDLRDAKLFAEIEGGLREEAIRANLALLDASDVATHAPPGRAEDLVAHAVADGANPAPFLEFLKKLLGMDHPNADADLGFLGDIHLTPPLAAASAEDKADAWFRQGLLGVCAHEYLRYQQGWTLVRSGSQPAASGPTAYSTAAVDLSFTHPGLAALKTVVGGKEVPVIPEIVLKSFPEAFQQGMAARSQGLGDIGPSAPERWEGELGKRTVHGLLTAYFPVTETRLVHWDRIAREAKAFNDGDKALRLHLALLMRRFGFEIVHVEFGQTPYRLNDAHGSHLIERVEPRVEHFGFRDGISQPFVDLRLKTPPLGGGRPAKDGTWAPVARGEIFLGPTDEDGLTADQPVNQTLRNGGTYLVFRKLEQDVAGFRAYLANQRSTPAEQERLAAQFVGRWPSGAPLVRHPNSDASYFGAQAETSINDFRYFAEDPQGRKCPIGAHVRRTNPRDIGGRDEVKRHRLLRRSMAYGGPLLPKGSLGDGRQRGLLFLAANSRIELQFEVIQRDWINGGEILGQVGAGRCPLTGANEGGVRDRFLEAGSIAPICGVPAFVTTKGGDYFFVPSVDALRVIAEAGPFEAGKLPFGPFSSSVAETPGLLSERRLKARSLELLVSLKQRYPELSSGPPSPPLPPARRSIRVQMPYEHHDTGPHGVGETMVFIGHHDDVVAALGGHPVPPSDGAPPADGDATAPGDSPAQCPFSVAHYLQASREITRGDALILAMDPGGPLGAKRARRLEILNRAYYAHPWSDFAHNHEVRDFIREAAGLIEQRVALSGHIDVLQDLAFYIPHLLVERYVGLPGPDYLSDLVVALPFAKRYITKLPPDWLKGRQNPFAFDPGYATMQMWSRLAFAEVIGNIQDKREFTEAAIQATSEMLTYIDEKIVEARRDPKRRQGTVLDALILQAPYFIAPDFDEDAYFAEVRAILADLMVTISINIGLPFSKAIQAALLFGFDCSRLVGLLETLPQREGYDNVELLAFELLRLYPSAPAIFRHCEANTILPSGATIRSGEWIAAILAVAGLDPSVFPTPQKFSLGTHLFPGGDWPARDPTKYLLFGPTGGVHRCWGEPLGRLVLGELFRAAARFRGLTRVAGPNGEVTEFPPRMDYGLLLKFFPFDPNREAG